MRAKTLPSSLNKMIHNNTPSYKDILRELDIPTSNYLNDNRPATNHIKPQICNPNAVTGDKNTFISHNLNILRYLDKGVLISLRYREGKFLIKLTRVKEHHLKIGGFNA